MIVLAVSLLALPALVFAADDDPATVAEALKLEVGKQVHLEGVITEKVGPNLYLFWDGSGAVKTLVSAKSLDDLNLKGDEALSIHGLVQRDKKSNAVFIEVESIEIAKPPVIDDEGDIFNEGVRDYEGCC